MEKTSVLLKDGMLSLYTTVDSLAFLQYGDWVYPLSSAARAFSSTVCTPSPPFLLKRWKRCYPLAGCKLRTSTKQGRWAAVACIHHLVLLNGHTCKRRGALG